MDSRQRFGTLQAAAESNLALSFLVVAVGEHWSNLPYGNDLDAGWPRPIAIDSSFIPQSLGARP